MPAGILILRAKGNQDVYLTANPEMNIFQYVHYKYVNFSNDIKRVHLSTTASFGGSSYVIIPKNGHLLSKMHLHLQIPALQSTELGKYACWSDALGYSIFDGPIELVIGGVIIDRIYPVGLDMLDELCIKTNGHNNMILKGDMYRDSMHNADKLVNLIIPLNFWFTKHYSLALPLLSMVNQEIRINFSFKTFNSLINYDSTIPPSPVNIISSDVYVEYLFLDDVILNEFQGQKHQYIITQMVYNGDDIIPANQDTFNTKIDFINPCQELLFACIDQNNLDNNNYFNYSRRSDESTLISQIKLLFDGNNRYDDNYLPEFIFRQFLPDKIHENIPTKHMYTMPFCIKPNSFTQMTGSANFSRFDEITLSLQMTPNNPKCKLYVFGMMINVVRIENGILSLEFMNNN
jgi:hypothetical protein